MFLGGECVDFSGEGVFFVGRGGRREGSEGCCFFGRGVLFFRGWVGVAFFGGGGEGVLKPFLSGLRSTKCLSDFLCIAWCHIRELVWNWLDTQSKLKVVAAGRDPWLQSGLDFGTAEIQYLLYVLHIGEEHHTNYESLSLGISQVLPSPLQASPMSVDHNH